MDDKIPELKVNTQPNIDSRLTWVRVTNANTYPRYELQNLIYQNEGEAQGKVNVFVEVLDELGRPAFGTRVRFNTTDGQNEAIQMVINGATDFPMSGDSSFSPDRGESGPYYVEVAGFPSDRVIGLGLPLKRHVTYSVRFQKVLGNTPVPAPIPAPIPVPTPVPGNRAITRDELSNLLQGLVDALRK